MGRRHTQEWAAAGVMAVVLVLVALDLTDDRFNSWFDRHSFLTDIASTLLGLAVAGLIVDRVADLRKWRERSQVMAAQAAMVAAQGMRTTRAVNDALEGRGEREDAADQLRTFMTLILISAPVLMDAPGTRHFLEATQGLAAELAATMRATRGGERRPEVERRLQTAAERVRGMVEPLLSTLNVDARSTLWRVTTSVGDDDSHPTDDPRTTGDGS